MRPVQYQASVESIEPASSVTKVAPVPQHFVRMPVGHSVDGHSGLLARTRPVGQSGSLGLRKVNSPDRRNPRRNDFPWFRFCLHKWICEGHIRSADRRFFTANRIHQGDRALARSSLLLQPLGSSGARQVIARSEVEEKETVFFELFSDGLGIHEGNVSP
jgi:hypothetical protein